MDKPNGPRHRNGHAPSRPRGRTNQHDPTFEWGDVRFGQRRWLVHASSTGTIPQENRVAVGEGWISRTGIAIETAMCRRDRGSYEPRRPGLRMGRCRSGARRAGGVAGAESRRRWRHRSGGHRFPCRRWAVSHVAKTAMCRRTRSRTDQHDPAFEWGDVRFGTTGRRWLIHASSTGTIPQKNRVAVGEGWISRTGLAIETAMRRRDPGVVRTNTTRPLNGAMFRFGGTRRRWLIHASSTGAIPQNNRVAVGEGWISRTGLAIETAMRRRDPGVVRTNTTRPLIGAMFGSGGTGRAASRARDPVGQVAGRGYPRFADPASCLVSGTGTVDKAWITPSTVAPSIRRASVSVSPGAWHPMSRKRRCAIAPGAPNATAFE